MDILQRFYDASELLNYIATMFDAHHARSSQHNFIWRYIIYALPRVETEKHAWKFAFYANGVSFRE